MMMMMMIQAPQSSLMLINIVQVTHSKHCIQPCLKNQPSKEKLFEIVQKKFTTFRNAELTITLRKR